MAEAPSSAVFLSYASQDAEAVSRIAEALRAAGVEVWFDKNELVGGDAWDRKIRQQIRECALFVPVISAATQSRGEGYFRLEWKLAVDRSHLMAPDQPFLLPVVIDATPDAAARVADEFRAVQWTRLCPGYGGQARDDALEKFCTRVKQLLGGSAVLQPALETSQRGLRHRAAVNPGRRVPAVAWIGALAVAVLIVGFVVLRPSSDTVAGTRLPSAEKSTSLTEAQKLIRQTWQLWEKWEDATVGDWRLADERARRAVELERDNAEAWAVHAQVSNMGRILRLNPAATPEEAIARAQRAAQLAPDSFEVKFALACSYRATVQTLPESERIFRELIAKVPNDGRVLRQYAGCLRQLVRTEECLAMLDRAIALPGSDAMALIFRSAILESDTSLGPDRTARAEEALDRAIRINSGPAARLYKGGYLFLRHGDLEGASTILREIPAAFFLEERGAMTAALLALWRNEPNNAITALNALSVDYLQQGVRIGEIGRGPRAFYLGMAHHVAGRAAAAQTEWNAALNYVDSQIADRPNTRDMQYWRAYLLAVLGNREGAQEALRVYRQLCGVAGNYVDPLIAPVLLALGDIEPVATFVRDEIARGGTWVLPHLQYDPAFVPLKTDPRGQALLVNTVRAAAAVLAAKSTPAAPAPAPNEKPAPADKSLVVLPLENLSPDPENAFFTDGMHAEIISTLQRTTDLQVIGRDSALAFKRGSTTVADFARRVGAVNVLSGSVRRVGTKARILVELRRASDDLLLWTSPNTERELTDIWAVQSEVAEQVARALKVRETAGSNVHARYLTKNPRAFDLVLKGDQRFFAGEFDQAIPLYTAAFELDTNYTTPAYMLSHAHNNLFPANPDPAVRVRCAAEARRWTEVAVQLDPGALGAIALAHHLMVVEEDNARGLEQAEKGMRALPQETASPTFRGAALERLGRVAEALESYRQALRIDPLLVFSMSNKLRALCLLRREAEAIGELGRFAAALESTPSAEWLLLILAQRRYELQGALPETISSVARPDERVLWLWRRRDFVQAERVAAAEAAKSDVNEVRRFELRLLQHDSLLRLNRTSEAGVVARDLLELARKLQSVPDVGPPRKAGWLARAEAHAGRPEDAIATGRRFIEDASPASQTLLHWQRESVMAELYAFLNRPRECCELLAKLLRVPSGLTVPMLKVDPAWDNVREEAAFQALLADPKNSAPL